MSVTINITSVEPDPIQDGNLVTVAYTVDPTGTEVSWTACNGPNFDNQFARGTCTTGSFQFPGQCYGRGGNDIQITISAGGASHAGVYPTNCPD